MTVLIRIIGPFSEVLDIVRSLEASDILHDREFVAEHYGDSGYTYSICGKPGSSAMAIVEKKVNQVMK